jgi:nucleotide-binding universal stress UspA family protein
MKILVAVDGSKPSLKAVQLLVEHADWYRDPPTVELVAIHLPVPKVSHIGKSQLERYYQEEGEGMLAAAKKKLDGAGIPYQATVLVGPVAETLVKHAKDKRCDLIYIGTRGMSELGKALVGSTATKVLHISDVPVLLVK